MKPVSELLSKRHAEVPRFTMSSPMTLSSMR